jgi:hypothetical protein
MTDSNTTEERPQSRTKEAIIEEAKRIEENCRYTSRGHFVAAHFWSNFHLWVGIPIVILSAVAGTSALSQFDNHTFVAGVISIIVVVLSATATFFNPRERANIHLSTGNNYDSLLTKARMFWTIDCWQEDSERILTEKLKNLSEERNRLNRECPQVPRFAYLRAKRGIKEGEATYEVDKTKTHQ